MRFLSPAARRAPALLALALLSPLPAAIPARAAVAEGTVLGAGSADAVAGRYLVVLRDMPGLGATASSLVGDRVTRTFPGLNAFAARLSAQDARRLAANPSVQFVEQDRQVHVDTTT